MELVQIEPARRTPAPKPEWLKARAPVGENYHSLKRLARRSLGTACCVRERRNAYNIGECWHHKTATFMMLGNLCTRRCGFLRRAQGPARTHMTLTSRAASPKAVATLGLETCRHHQCESRDDDLVGPARASSPG